MEEYRREVELRLCSQVKYKIGWFIRAENVLPLSNTAGYDTAKTILTFVEDNIQMRLLNNYNTQHIRRYVYNYIFRTFISFNAIFI